jgi:hypothetical protein
MFRRTKRQIVFVCSAIQNDSDLISEIIPASSSQEASKLFEDKFFIKPKNILGPFIKKKAPQIEVNTSIKFEGLPKQAIYNGWLVNAFLLKVPENTAFLIFLKPVDSDKTTPPKGTTIIPITDLRFI